MVRSFRKSSLRKHVGRSDMVGKALTRRKGLEKSKIYINLEHEEMNVVCQQIFESWPCFILKVCTSVISSVQCLYSTLQSIPSPPPISPDGPLWVGG